MAVKPATSLPSFKWSQATNRVRMATRRTQRFSLLLAGFFAFALSFAAIPASPADIHAAAKAGDLAAVRRLIQIDASLVNLKDVGGNAPLHAAAEGGAVSVAAYLIDRGADLDARNISGNTPLHEAIFNGKDKISRLLIEKGADLRSQNTIGRTPLHHAARYNRKATAELLLAKGVSVDSRDRAQRTPLLLLTLMTTNVDVARVLIQRGADVNAQDANGNMPLEQAAHNGSLALIDLLLDRGAGFHTTRDHALTTMRLAAAAGSARLFKVVAEKGGAALFNTASDNASTMAMAISGGSLEIVDMLLAKGIPIDGRPNIAGWTPLHRAVQGKANGLIEMLVKNGVDIDARTNDGRSAYNIAEAQGNQEALALILKLGGNSEPQKFPVLTGPYLGQILPDVEPKRFAPGIVTGGHTTVAVSPDGREIYWAEAFRIVVSRLENGHWTRPAVVSFSGASDTPMYDDAPFVAPDNKRLFFTSLRPVGSGSGSKENIWFVDRTSGGWSTPRPVSPEINAMQLHWQVSVSNSGTLFFAGKREGEADGIYYSRLVNGEYARPENAGPAINSPEVATCPFIAPDESYIIFARVRNGELEGLFISFKAKDGQWLPPGAFSKNVDSPTAIVSPDGKCLFTGLSWMDAKFIEELRPRDSK
ncbi:MAG: ankyrin repeat domain-containing protein [Acidobacteriota bacterium]